MNRPQVTPELIATVAATFCSSHGWDASQADDLARVYRRRGRPAARRKQ